MNTEFDIKNNFLQRDEEMQDIISRPPSLLVTRGLTVFFCVFVLLLSLTWFIGYPDLIKAKVVITTVPSPINLVSRIGGKIILLKRDNSHVMEQEPIAFIESNASTDDVLQLDSILSASQKKPILQPRSFRLGDLQSGFSLWEKAIENRDILMRNQIATKQIAKLESQILSQKKMYKTQEGQLRIARKEFDLAKVRFKTDSLLFKNGVNSAIDFNKASSDFLLQERNVKNSEMALIGTELQITTVEKQIAELQATSLESLEKTTLEVAHTHKELKGQISKWKETYLFVSSREGTVSYMDFLEDGKYIEMGKPIFSVIPSSNEIIGRAELPILGSGKVKKGQKVNIRLDNFPFEQYGMLRGQIKEISSLPTDDKYLVTIDLPDTLRTTTKRTLVFRQQMQGETEIITEDLTLLERFFYHLKALVKRNP